MKEKESKSFKKIIKLQKAMIKNITNEMEEDGPTLWDKYKKKRIYFKIPNDIVKLDIDFKKDKSIRKATLKGKKLDKKRAQELVEYFKALKIYYDVYTSKLNIVHLPGKIEKEIIKEIKIYFVEKIRKIKIEARKEIGLNVDDDKTESNRIIEDI